MLCKICLGEQKKVATFYNAQKNENLFGLEKKKNYKRSIYICKKCGHYTNQHSYSFFLKKVYKENYAKFSYGKVSKKFFTIKNLPKKKSSNYYRCKFLINNLYKLADKKILDIGAGFGIFAHAMKQFGWNVEALEVNRDLKKFILNKLKIKTIGTDIIKKQFNKNKKFNLITLNKVLEHFDYPESKKILKKIKKILSPGGYVYIEVPDGEAAGKKSLKRQEFFLEHYNIFSIKSVKTLLHKLNFKIFKIKKLREINGKYTIRVLAK
jgi:2-polyprenyl-3-methyl-5-hydroxy-6-metoxy-1,4-benzoquinol methylase|tara:strand:- start:481 stop:1278 length:798 start_codon:yes stop_codon:yes gene_type:complete